MTVRKSYWSVLIRNSIGSYFSDQNRNTSTKTEQSLIRVVLYSIKKMQQTQSKSVTDFCKYIQFEVDLINFEVWDKNNSTDEYSILNMKTQIQ